LEDVVVPEQTIHYDETKEDNGRKHSNTAAIHHFRLGSGVLTMEDNMVKTTSTKLKNQANSVP